MRVAVVTPRIYILRHRADLVEENGEAIMSKTPFVAFLIVLSVVLSGCLDDINTDKDTNKTPVAQIESIVPNHY